MNCFQFRGKRVCRNDAFSFCFSSVSCFSFLCQEKRTTSFFPPPTHILESVLLTNAFAGRTDVSSLPLERTRHLRHRDKAVLPESAIAFTQNLPTHPIKAAAVFFFCLLRLISQLGRLVGMITGAEKEGHPCS